MSAQFDRNGHVSHPQFYAASGELDDDENEVYRLLCVKCGREYRLLCADDTPAYGETPCRGSVSP